MIYGSARGIVVSAFPLLFVAACGARGPLDDFTLVGGGNNVADSGVSVLDGAPPGTPGTDASTPPGTPTGDDSGPGTPTGPGNPIGIPGLDSGLITCGTCVAQQCGTQITACIQDPSCSSVLQCVATNCLGGALGGLGGGGTGGSSGGGGGSGGGGSCFTSCGGSGGLGGLAPLFPILTCVAGTCGSSCGSVLGGLGGLGGAVGSPIQELAIPNVPPTPGAAKIVFSAFPQVCGE